MRIGNWTGNVARWSAVGVLVISGAAVMAAGTKSSPATQPGAVSTGAGKHHKHEAGMGGEFKNVNLALADLALTGDQHTRISALMSDFTTAKSAWLGQHKADMTDIKAQIKAAHTAGDKAAGKEAKAKLTALEATGPNYKDTFTKIRDVLTPDQQAAFDAKMVDLSGGKHSKAGATSTGVKHSKVKAAN